MGFLKHLILLFLFGYLFISGCATSLIKTTAHRDDNPYPSFGKNPGREFFINDNIPDSVTLKWQNDANGGFTNSSVVIYDSLVFINDLSGRIYCYNIKNGKKVGQLKNDGSVFTSPYIYKFYLIYAAADDNENITHLKYYDFVAGNLVHDIEVDGRCVTEIIGSPDYIIFNTENGNVYKYDMKGEQIWKTETSSVVHSSPSLNNDIIIFGNDSGEIIAIDNNDGKIIYRKKIGKSFFCGTSISGNVAYTGNDDGNLYAINLKTGEVNWKYQSGARIVMTPSLTKNEIYFGNLNGDLFCLSRKGRQLWKTSTGGILNATPFVTNNLMVVPDLNEKFYFVDVQNGNIKKTYTVDGRVKLSPVIFRNMLFIGYDRGELEAYEFK